MIKNIRNFIFIGLVVFCNFNASEVYEDMRKIRLLELENGARLRELLIDIQNIYIAGSSVERIDTIAREIVNMINTYSEYNAFLDYIDYMQERMAREICELEKYIYISHSDQLWKFVYNKNTIYFPVARDIELIRNILISKEQCGVFTDLYILKILE